MQRNSLLQVNSQRERAKTGDSPSILRIFAMDDPVDALNTLAKEPIHQFGPFVLDTGESTLTRDGKRVHLPKKNLSVLAYLITHSPELVTRDELLENFWSGGKVYDEAVYRCLSLIRRALDDTEEPPEYIETQYRKGYRFIGELESQTRPANVTPTSKPNWPVRLGGIIVITLIVWAGFTNWQLPKNSPAISSIAVLPVNGGETEQWALSGLSYEINHAMANLEGFRVVTVSQAKPVLDQTFVEKLGVDALLKTNFVQDADGGVLLQAQLLHTENLALRWSMNLRAENYQLRSAPGSLVTQLAHHLSANLRKEPEPKPSEQAYQHYLKGRALWQQRTPDALYSALDEFNSAVVLEPDYLSAHLALAETWMIMPLYARLATKEAIPKARAAAEKALELNDNSARAYAVLGVIASEFDWDKLQAETNFIKAITLDPNDASAHQWKAEYHCFQLEFDLCRSHLKTALALDPLSPIIILGQGLADRFSLNLDAAEQYYQKMVVEFPTFPYAKYQLALVIDAQEDYAKALPLFEDLLPIYGLEVAGSSLVRGYWETGQKARAKAMYEKLLAARSEGKLSAMHLAAAMLRMGSYDDIMYWLEVAEEEKDGFLVLLSIFPDFSSLKGTPRFDALLDRIDIPTRRLEKQTRIWTERAAPPAEAF